LVTFAARPFRVLIGLSSKNDDASGSEALVMSLDEVKTKAKEYLEDCFLDPSKFSLKLAEFFSFTFDNYESMDSEAKAYVDSLQGGYIGLFSKGVDRLPEGPERRNLKRLVALARGKHFKAENLAKSLSSAPEYEFPIIQEAEPVFFAALQHLLDVLYDATSASHRGVARFSAISLMYWVVDELQVAFHLAQRKYASQAYAHVRIVYEHLDKVALFHKYPKWADVWASGNSKANMNELKPSAVRQKLGLPKFDPVYSFFSEMGTHGTFRGVQDRVAKRVKPEGTGIAVSVWVGGIPRKDQVVQSICACIFAVVSSLLVAQEVFQDRLNMEEAVQVLQCSIDQSIEFLKTYLVGWAQESGFDVTELLNHLMKKPSFI
jgi:hypothetical protein